MNKLSNISRYFLIFAAFCIASNLYFPMWRIDLDAPQYPEGLRLLIYHNKLAGDVEIINGLNHYIGMRTLHAEEFIEFSVLKYFFLFFTMFALLVAFTKSKKMLLMLLISLVLFGIVAMYDFWRWEYEYGHNLDPTAAIIVPGMAYQPPLIGFKQLLNFGAYSIPDIGGWLLVLAGLIIFSLYVYESGLLHKFTKSKRTISIFLAFCIFFISCKQIGPDPIVLNKDTCSYCKMTISDAHFAAEIISDKGRVNKFDDITCLISFSKEKPQGKKAQYYVNNFLSNNILIDATAAFFVKDEKLKSPMAGNIAAFKSVEEASNFSNSGHMFNWESLISK